MNELFGLFEVLFGIFALSLFANRPLFAANREYKSTQKLLSTKLEIKSKQLLTVPRPHSTGRSEQALGALIRKM